MRCLAEMNHDFRHFSRHLLAGTDIKRDAAPTPITDTKLHGNVCFRTRVGSYPFLFTISFFSTGGGILPAHNMLIQIFFIQRCQRLIYFHHLITEVIRIEDSRRFHSSKSYKLNQMILYHIPQSSRRFVESATLLDSQILYSGNFYVVDIIPVPERLENTIGKTESQHILRCLFTEKMINTVNLMFFENRSINFIQFTCRFEVVTERFFNDDTRMGSIQSCSFQMQGNNTVK